MNIGYRAAPAFADIDDDGDPDLFIGVGSPVGHFEYYGAIKFFRNEAGPPLDTTPPECEIAAVDDGPPKRLDIRVQDPGSGLASISVLKDDNAMVPSGLYFYRLRAGAFEQARTMMLVR